MAFWLRAISSISIGLIFLLVIAQKILTRKSLFPDRISTLFIIGCIAFYAIQFAGCINHLDDPICQKHLRIKSALMFIPLAVTGSGIINNKNRNKFLSFFTISIIAACLFCLIAAIIQFFQTKNPLNFFYYELVKPFSFHAIYFSILVFIVLAFLWETLRKKEFFLHRSVHIAAIIFLSVFLFLLSSRLVISWYILYILFFFLVKWRKKITIAAIAISLLAAGYFILISNNPVSKRFDEIIKGDLSVIKQERFDPGDYFGGLQFRLLYWRFVPEILSEKKSWLTGTGPANSQSILDKKYVEKNLYIGNPSKGDKGFLGYNTHSQFLESLLQSGLIGLIIFIFICFTLIKMIWLAKDRMMTFVTLLLLVYSLIESLFETQYGILLFLFFPLFFFHGKKTQSG
jgi:O-antigen ligase